VRLPSRVRLWLGSAALAITVASGLSAIVATTGLADSQDIALDRQAYVPDAGPDAYQYNSAAFGGCTSSPPCPDPASLHVGAGPNQPTYHSLVHIELSAIPPEDTVSSLVLTLAVQTDTTVSNQSANEQNLNPSAWILDAYPLATELPASFTGCTASAGCNAPAADTGVTPVVGKAVTDSSGTITAFTFEVAPLLPYWQSKGANTGLAIVPAAGATQQPWVVAFNRNQDIASATVRSPGGAMSVIPPAPPVVTTAHSSGGGGTTVPVAAAAPLPTAAATALASAAATPAPVQKSTPPVVIVQPASSGQIPVWLLVFGISLAFSVALLAQPAAQAFSSAAGLRAGTLAQLKLHPRMVAVAGTLLIWSSGWGVYSHATTTGPSAPVASSGGNHGPVAGIPSYAPLASTPSASAAATGTAAPGGGAGSGTTGNGNTGPTVNGAPVGAAAFAGSTPVAPRANLYTGADNFTGITNTSIQMCAHAALTFGPAFNIRDTDLNVFWQMVNDPANDPYPHTAGQGGIYNRKILQPNNSDGIAIQDDGYQPSKAVQAAENCQSQTGGDFFLLSGIGFDQIPNVRSWAEQQHMLYIHHIATQARGLQYSFTMLPTLEQIGTQFGQYYLSHLNGKKVGIIERQSSNWSPGITTFRAALQAAGESANIVKDDPVSNNQGDYTKQVLDMKTAGAQVVFIWENALAADQIIQQSSNQSYDPKWLLFPFNLTLYTLNQSQVDTSGMQGIVPWPAYTSSSAGCTSGGSGITRNDADYGQYMQEIKAFEAAYAKWDPSADLCGDGGDLLFGTWEAWRQVADLLVKCGVNCSRNAIAGVMLNGYTSTVGANCEVSFAGGDHHHGGGPEDLYAVKPENGGPGWVNTGYCESTIQ
jgi:ABC-type branched-subunit amino acid transport system substrate-binding protein